MTKALEGRPRLAELRRLLAIAVPLWAAQMASVALPFTDAIYMGRLGQGALAGGGLASILLATAVLIGGSALGGLSPRVARAHARADPAEVALLVRHARWLALGVAVPLVALAFGGEALLLAAGQDADVAQEAGVYLRSAAAAVPFLLGCTIGRGLLAACGRASTVTFAWVLAVPLNLALDHALAVGVGPIPAMGLAGVGLATSLVSLAVFLFLIVAAARSGLEGRHFWLGRRDRRVAKDLALLGAPIAFAVGAEAGAFAIAGIAVGWFGGASLAAHRIAMIITHFCFLVPLSLSQAAAVRVAATESDHGHTSARVSLLASLAWALAAGMTIVLCAPGLTSLFLPAEDPATPIAIAILYVVATFQVVDALQSVAAGVLRGRGDTMSAMRWSLLAYGIVVPAVATLSVLGAGLDAMGVWVGLAAGLLVAALGLVPKALRASRPISLEF